MYGGFQIFTKIYKRSRPGTSVGITTGYGLHCPGIESRWKAKFSAPVQTGPGAHPAFCTLGTRSFRGVKSGRGVTLTPHPLLVPLVMKEYSYTFTPPMGRTAFTEPQCLYKGALYLYLPFFIVFIEHAPLLSVVLHAVSNIYMCFTFFG
jgi:hypothetical protein